MGTSASILLSQSSFSHQRNDLVHNLSESFQTNPKNQKIIHNINKMKETLSKERTISVVAEKELTNTALPTCLISAQIEYERLSKLCYEDMNRSSVVSRTNGNIACPLGHRADKYDTEIRCNICQRSSFHGFFCSFCEYGLCEHLQPW
jgi:hypothetical protein